MKKKQKKEGGRKLEEEREKIHFQDLNQFEFVTLQKREPQVAKSVN